jgi:cytochrome c oxidase subunit 2
VPTITTDEMRQEPAIMKKVANINEIRSKKSAQLVAEGKTALDPYTFDYLLLCNKICGASHYNMQMKVVVEDDADFKKWLSGKEKLSAAVKKAKDEAAAAAAEPAAETVPAKPADSATAAKPDSTIVAQVVKK